MKRRMPRILPTVLMAAAAAFPVLAADWGQLATISSTLGVNANRLCVGEGLRSDIGCPTYAPYVSATNGFIGFGVSAPEARLDVVGSTQGTVTTLGAEVPGFVLQQRVNSTIGPMMEFRLDNGANIWTAGAVVGRSYSNYAGGLAFFTQAGNVSNDPAGRRFGGTDLVERLTIDQFGRLGIGATAPTSRLHVSTTGSIVVGRFETDGNASLELARTGASSSTGVIQAATGGSFAFIADQTARLSADPNNLNANSAIQFMVDGTERGRFNSSGNFGISTTNPNAKLEVNGDISATNLRLSGNLYVSGSQTFDGVTFANGGVSATGIITATSFSGDGSRLTGLASGDRITSGTSSIVANNNSYVSLTVGGVPVARLNSFGAVFASGAVNTPYWVLQNSSTSLALLKNGDSFLNVRSPDNTGMTGVMFNGAGYRGSVYAAPSYHMYIRPNDEYGKANLIILPERQTNGMSVGVNTASPQATLQVSGSFTVSTSAQTTTPSLYVGTNGRVGIGTNSPLAKLDITSGNNSIGQWGGNIAFGYYLDGGYRHWISTKHHSTSGSGNALEFYLNNSASSSGSSAPGTNNTMVMGLYGPGSVGIGTTAPSSTLHVSGTARITSWTAIAANVTPTTELDVYGTISATNILVNGAPITATADRITSGTTNVIANNASGYVSFTSSGVTTGHYSPGGIFSAAGISISTNQASFTTVYASGRVGIGITNPSHPLDISTSTANTGLRLQNLGGAVNLAMTPSSASSWSLIQNTRGQFLIGNSESSGYGYIGFRAGGSALDQLRISHVGNVGIGTILPGKTLSVSGTAEFVSRTLVGGTGTPSATFQVSGSLLLAGNDNIPCTDSVLGLVRRNPTTGRLQACR